MTTHRQPRRRGPEHKRRDREEGAALLVVMMILLMVTATATFAIHSTANEIRAAGNARMAMQTSYLGESAVLASMDWVDRQGPRVLVDLIRAREDAGNPGRLDLAPFEPPLAPDSYAHRLYLSDLDPASKVAPSTLFDPPGGTRHNAYVPLAVVDIYDLHVYTGVTPGFSATGGGSMHYVRATYTARGRSRLAGTSSTDIQRMHESAGDARAVGISGPFAM